MITAAIAQVFTRHASNQKGETDEANYSSPTITGITAVLVHILVIGGKLLDRNSYIQQNCKPKPGRCGIGLVCRLCAGPRCDISQFTESSEHG